MTWNLTLQGHDSHPGAEEREAFENWFVERSKSFMEELSATEGCIITGATVNTTSGGVISLMSLGDDEPVPTPEADPRGETDGESDPTG